MVKIEGVAVSDKAIKILKEVVEKIKEDNGKTPGMVVGVKVDDFDTFPELERLKRNGLIASLSTTLGGTIYCKPTALLIEYIEEL